MPNPRRRRRKQKSIYDVLLYALLHNPPGVVSQSVGAKASWIQQCLEQHGYWIAPQSLSEAQEEIVLQGLGMPTMSVSAPGREAITAFWAGYANLMLTEHPNLIVNPTEDTPV